MLGKIFEKNANMILDKCEKDFENGLVCERYLKGVADAINKLTLNVLDDYYEALSEEDEDVTEVCEVSLMDVKDITLDMLTDEGASLLELAFAEKILDDYIDMVDDLSNDYVDDEDECSSFRCNGCFN